MKQKAELDTVVIGGGVVGMSVAYGLARAGERVRLLDEGDDAFRAARGNFGLVWVQGKGLDQPAYARWNMAAARQWPAFARELAERTGTDVELSQIGGLILCLSDDELAQRAAGLEAIRQQVGSPYPYDVLDLTQLRALSPFAGPEVAGAVFCPLDGHVSPLRLLRALVQGFSSLGGELRAGVHVDAIAQRGGEFRVRTGNTEHVAAKLVLAAGLGNRALAPLVGLEAPVQPNRGQILVTERFNRPFCATRHCTCAKPPKVWCRSETPRKMSAWTTAPPSLSWPTSPSAPGVASLCWGASISCAPGVRCA